MSKFQFRLASVAQLRQRRRDEASQAYQKAMQAKQQLENHIQELQSEHDRLSEMAAPAEGQVVQTTALLETRRYQSHLLFQVAELQSKVSQIDEVCEQRRLALVHHEQQVRTLEKLEEKQKSEWQTAQQAAEQDILDQWSGYNFWKQNKA